jgi:hypothetical protein
MEPEVSLLYSEVGYCNCLNLLFTYLMRYAFGHLEIFVVIPFFLNQASQCSAYKSWFLFGIHSI